VNRLRAERHPRPPVHLPRLRRHPIDAHHLALLDGGIARDRDADDLRLPIAERDQLQLGTAATDVLAERRRQISAEGRPLEHDDEYTNGDLAAAAGCYALHAHDDNAAMEGAPVWWPWETEWWKPSDPRRNLVKAGALILAEIERLDRAAAKATDLVPEEGLPEGLSWEDAPADAIALIGGKNDDDDPSRRLLVWVPELGRTTTGVLALAFDSRPAGSPQNAALDSPNSMWTVVATRPVQAADGWIEWDGRDELPKGLEPGQMVWVRLQETGAERPGTADRWTWGWEQADYRGVGRIVAYRLTQPPAEGDLL